LLILGFFDFEILFTGVLFRLSLFHAAGWAEQRARQNSALKEIADFVIF